MIIHNEGIRRSVKVEIFVASYGHRSLSDPIVVLGYDLQWRGIKTSHEASDVLFEHYLLL